MKTDNVPGFPGYFVSKSGKVYSRIGFKYMGYKKGNTRIYTKKWHKLKLYLKPNGKYQVSMYKPNDKKVYTKMVHRLVATIYVPNPNNLPCVCHKDDVGTHNHYKNLVWGTVKNNVKMMIVNHNRLKKPLWTKPPGFNKGVKNPAYGKVRYGTLGQLNKEEIIELLNDHDNGVTTRELANKYNVPIKTVYRKIRLKFDILHKFGIS